MKVSYNWLNSFFDGKLPPVAEVADALTFHAWEVEDMEQVGNDTVFEVKVLPDKTPHALSHRGIAKELSVILGKALSRDPLQSRFESKEPAAGLMLDIQSPLCTRYVAASIRGVTVGPSPKWLEERLTALGQRSINNIVDATNFVMFDLGQPLHAFDADKLVSVGGSHTISVRTAREGERIVTLTGEEYTLTINDLLIVDGGADAPIGIAGIKGGKCAEVDTKTTNIIIESANFNPISTRKSSQRLKLRTDASARFENGIAGFVAEPGLFEVVELILKVAGGTFTGFSETPFTEPERPTVSVPLSKVERVLGVPISAETVRGIMDRFGYAYTLAGDILNLTPPPERTDLVIPEDLIEELGRIHGLEHIPSITPEPAVPPEINKRFFYSEVVRDALTALGFSEVYTSSFRPKDTVQLANAFAADKGYLRSSLRDNLAEALLRNVPNRDLLGLPHIAIFEIGTVFGDTEETYALALGVRHGMEYREKADKKFLDAACDAVGRTLGVELSWQAREGIAELDFGSLLSILPEPTTYALHEPHAPVTFVPYSNYPAMSRDIAFWTTGPVTADELAACIRENAGPLLARITLFDEFSKDGRASYAFRLVFQSSERTLTDEEVSPLMQKVTGALVSKGFEVR